LYLFCAVFVNVRCALVRSVDVAATPLCLYSLFFRTLTPPPLLYSLLSLAIPLFSFLPLLALF
jgi:hypothetical protein